MGKPDKENEAGIFRQREYIRKTAKLPHKPQTYCIITFGCQMNAHDSEKIAGMLEEMGIRPAPGKEEADIVIFNTCCIRDNAERKALGNITWLNEVKKQRPELLIAVCGCMVQQKGMKEKLLRQYPFIDLAFGTSNLDCFPEMLFTRLNSVSPLIDVREEDTVPEELPIKRLRKDFAYITVMYGCDNYCSYCIVPYVRGRERSRKMETILREASQLADEGVKEIMLLGQNVNSYGKGLPEGLSFARLLRELDRTGIPRIRFMTSHPKDLSDELISVMAESRHVLPQFHLPVQSGSNRILKQMNRRYTREQYLNRVDALRREIPGIGLSTDIIVGFPGETEEDFRETVDLMETVGFDSAFTFIYSPRTGTRAAKMEHQIDPETASERIQKLIHIQDRIQGSVLSRFVGTEETILVEGISKRSSEEISGRGTHGVSITLPGNKNEIGEIIPCRITGVKHNTLIAERITV